MSTALKRGHPVPWLRRLAAGISPWRLRLNIRLVRKGFMVDRVPVGQFFLRALEFFTLIISINASYYQINHQSYVISVTDRIVKCNIKMEIEI